MVENNVLSVWSNGSSTAIIKGSWAFQMAEIKCHVRLVDIVECIPSIKLSRNIQETFFDPSVR